MRTSIVANGAGPNATFSVHVEGLDPLMRFLAKSDPALRKAIRTALEESGGPVLRRARANAGGWADDGTFRSGLAIKTTARGGIRLVNTDPQAGVKEFSKVGSRHTYERSVKGRRQTVRNALVGAPRRANPPRAMVPAVNDSIDEVKSRVDDALERVLKGGLDG